LRVGTWLVTGANRGIGLQFAGTLAGRGERVVGTARRPDRAEDLRKTGARIEALDISVDATVAALAESLAGEPIDVLVLNAAIGEAGPAVEHLVAADVERTLNVDAVGAVRVFGSLLPNLRAGKRRTVVALSSGLASIHRNEEGGWIAYRMAKAALNMFVRSAASELAREKFICVLIDPGWVQTDMGGPGAPLTPEASVEAMLRAIDSLRPSDSGRFLDRRGRDVPW
jgi:NAD(P)-dependent dehydrogenase (short-subunit alcohol dehydrogenase family)